MKHLHFIRKDGRFVQPFAACGAFGETYRNPDVVTCKSCKRTRRYKQARAEIHPDKPNGKNQCS